MSAVLDAIEVKKAGGALDEATLEAVVTGYTAGEVPDEQMSALLMAILLRGMTYAETLALTRVMADSGPRYAFPDCVDKHSTGGVGDKVTLIALPVVAALRGARREALRARAGDYGRHDRQARGDPRLHHRAERGALPPAGRRDRHRAGRAGRGRPRRQGDLRAARHNGHRRLAAAHRLVDRLQKAATGAGHLLYDVKRGSGTFMKTTEQARELAELLVRLSGSMGVRSSALITDMDAPLGRAVGNVLEVREAVAVLRGEPTAPDLAEVAREVAVRLLELKGVEGAGAVVEDALRSGAAHAKLVELVRAQGGDPDALEDLPVSRSVVEVTAPRSGFVARFDALGVGRAAVALGAGRERKGDPVDPGAGVELLVGIGDEVQESRLVARLYGEKAVDRARELVAGALEVADERREPPPHVVDRL
jgi:thymidine phosphorylase